MKTTTPSTPRLSIYAGDPVIDGRLVPHGDGELPSDFGKTAHPPKGGRRRHLGRAGRVAGAGAQAAYPVGEREPKPSGGAYHCLVRLAPWIPGGLDILMGEDFLDPLKEK